MRKINSSTGYIEPKETPKIPIDILFENCKKAVRKEIRKDCWKEAYEILELCEEKDRQDFFKYHQEDKGNICCLVLDFAKKKLVDEGKMEQKENDKFKNPYIWLNDESNNKKE
jgi:ribosomal protein L22